MNTLSAIVPMLNEAADDHETLHALRRGAPDAEIVVVDGGSIDEASRSRNRSATLRSRRRAAARVR